MAQIVATTFLVLLALGVLKMVFDVQVSKIKKIEREIKDFLDQN
jgi:hypothetical protein